MSIKILAIDSSLAATGVVWGEYDTKFVPQGSKLITTKKDGTKKIRVSADTINRCRHTYQEISRIIQETSPDIICVETPSGSQNASAAKSYGATCCLYAVLTPPPLELTPKEVKVASAGKNASKASMIRWAVAKYPTIKWKKGTAVDKYAADNEHVADALGVVEAAILLPEFQRLIKLVK